MASPPTWVNLTWLSGFPSFPALMCFQFLLPEAHFQHWRVLVTFLVLNCLNCDETLWFWSWLKEGVCSNFTFYTIFKESEDTPRSFMIFLWSSIFLAVANFSFFVAVHFFRSVLCVMTGQRARSIVGRGDHLAKSCTTCTLWTGSCTSCTLHIVPWTLHGCCGQGGSSHQIGPQLNTNLPRFKIFVDTNGTGNDKDKDRGCHVYLFGSKSSPPCFGWGIFIFPFSSFVLKHIVEHFHISSVDWSVSFHR